MSNQTPGQEAAAEARAACNNLTQDEKVRLAGVAYPALRANHPLDAFDESEHEAVIKYLQPIVSTGEETQEQLDTLRYMETAGIAIKEREMIRSQRDRAISIADEALANGHAYHCTFEEGRYRCRCGVLQMQEELRKLRSEI
jgi:hypothetical protein